MSSQRPADTWSDGDAYEAYVGRWSRLVAGKFLAWLGTGEQLRWLDVGAGTGALSAVIAEIAGPRAVVGVDTSAAYVDDARRRVDDPRVRFERSDAGSLRYDAEFDAAVSGLVLNFVGPGPTKRAADRLRRTRTFVPDARAAVNGMRRAVVPGGVVAAYV